MSWVCMRRTGFDGDCFSWFLMVGGGQDPRVRETSWEVSSTSRLGAVLAGSGSSRWFSAGPVTKRLVVSR